MKRGEKRILVVDDHPPIVRMIEANLTKQGYQVETALDGAVALEKLRASHFDLLIADAVMPEREMDGIRLSQSVRYDPALSGMLILLMDIRSQYKEDRLDERVQESGADAGLSKPFAPKELCVSVDRLLSRDAEIKGASGLHLKIGF